MQHSIWECKIGFASSLPPGADRLMREAVTQAYIELTRQRPDFAFSGWGGKLTAIELEVLVDARLAK